MNVGSGLFIQKSLYVLNNAGNIPECEVQLKVILQSWLGRGNSDSKTWSAEYLLSKYIFIGTCLHPIS